jgi:hypothetical protein
LKNNLANYLSNYLMITYLLKLLMWLI